MDAPDTDFDIKLQKLSADLIADLDRALTTLLRKHDGHGGTTVRSLVRARDTFESTTSVGVVISGLLSKPLTKFPGSRHVSRAPAAIRPASP